MIHSFADAKFGLFIHWGVYSHVARGEWALNHLPEFNDGTADGIRAYRAHASAFTAAPSGEDHRTATLEHIRRIVSAAKSAGMTYILLVARHHDGFSLWATQASEWAAEFSSPAATPSGLDIVGAFAAETRRQGLRLSIYYSLLDWLNPLYPDVLNDVNPLDGEPYSLAVHRDRVGDLDAYLGFMRAQLRELLTIPDVPIASVWFDGFWALKDVAGWRIEELYGEIRRLSPETVIGTNKGLGFSSEIPGEGFQISELGLAGLGHADGVPSEVDLTIQVNPETETADDFWGYNAAATIHDAGWVLRRLVECLVGGHNLVLNVGPNAAGALRPSEFEVLNEVGRWVEANHDAVFGVEPAGSLCPNGTVRRTGVDQLELFVYLFEDSVPSVALELPSGAVIRSAQPLDPRSNVQLGFDGSVVTVRDLIGSAPSVVRILLDLAKSPTMSPADA